MLKIKNFAIFKNKPSDNEKVPTHSISAKVGEVYVNIGSAWTKEGKNGKFLSAKLSDIYVDHTDNSKSRKSIVLVDEADLKALFAKAGEDYVDEATIPSTKPKTAPQDNLDAF